MARNTFPAEVLTPDGELFNGEVELVATKTVGGSLGILAGHQPLLAIIDPSELRLYRPDGEIERLIQGEGYLQVSGDGGVLILVEEAYRPGELDLAELADKLSSARQAYADAEPHSAARRFAAREQHRLEAFQRIAGSG